MLSLSASAPVPPSSSAYVVTSSSRQFSRLIHIKRHHPERLSAESQVKVDNAPVSKTQTAATTTYITTTITTSIHNNNRVKFQLQTRELIFYVFLTVVHRSFTIFTISLCMYIFSIYLVNLPFTAHDRPTAREKEKKQKKKAKYVTANNK